MSTTKPEKAKGNKKYITLDGGVDFRKIAETMTTYGYRMNHATARNQLMVAMEKVLSDVAKQAGARLSRTQLKGLLQNQAVHDALADILHVIHEPDASSLPAAEKTASSKEEVSK